MATTIGNTLESKCNHECVAIFETGSTKNNNRYGIGYCFSCKDMHILYDLCKYKVVSNVQYRLYEKNYHLFTKNKE